MLQEYKLVRAVVQHLILRDSTLIIIEEPEVDDGQQRNRNRVLAVNPNYVEA